MNFKNLAWIFLLFIQVSAWSQSQFSLDDALAYAASNHNNIRISQLDLSDAQSQINEYRAIGLPKLNLGIDYQYNIQIPQVFFADMQFAIGTNNNLAAGLSFKTQLFDASWIYGLKAARAYKNQKASEIENTRYQVKAQVLQAYLAVLINEENLKTINKNIDNLTQSLNETEAIYQNGFAEQLDVDRLSLTVENLTMQRENLIRLIDIAKNNLKYAMGYPMGDEIVLLDDLQSLANKILVDEVELAEEVDYNQRPEYRTILEGEILNDLDLKRLRAGYYPTLDAFANYNQSLQRNSLFDSNEPGFIPSSLVGVSIKLPIFDGLSKKSSIQRTKIRIDKTSIQKDEFERSVDMAVTNARINFKNAKLSVRMSQNSLDIANEIYDKAAIKYKEGVGSSIELSQAERSLFEAQASYSSALYQLVVAKAQLDTAEGNI